MKKILAFLALSAALVVPSHASVIYTSAASLLANVTGGSYTNTFDGLSELDPGAAAFASSGFSYNISAPNDLYAADDILSTSQINQALTINFTSGNVFAIGANFFVVNLENFFQSVSLTLTLSDGTIETFTPTSISDSYRGFLSNVAITSLAIGAPGQSLYAGLDNLTVGTVPEPTSWALLGLGLVGFLVARRRAV
jgi:hypothetical protein